MYKALSLLFLTFTLGACQNEIGQTGPDLDKLRSAILEKQDLLLQIHLDLDAAATEMTNAELTARDDNCSAAEFHAAEAYRKLEKADEAILDLGRDLQALFNLDVKGR